MNAVTKPIKISVTTGSLPASRKVYLNGARNPDIQVPMREISLDPSANEPPVRVYDTSGPYTDPDTEIDIHKGLPRLRANWIRARGDVEEYEGRTVKAEDNGTVDRKHLVAEFPVRHRPLLPPPLGTA